ncbi:glycosyltransferase family 2 protein [Chitinimonas sp.]|uniref:glycosyltransferase family 2 protein n=1 Tax=Chitinimonas sp. TaxID=1934313 RepID=UPI002F936D67
MMVAKPRVAVITPYYRESDFYLQRCMDSVAAQHYPCTHFLIADDRAEPLVSGRAGVRHVELGQAHGDYGDTPRAVGSLLAMAEGFDAIAYLDADNYYLPEHIAGLVATWQAQQGLIDVIASQRFFVYPDGRLMPLADQMDARTGVDTNCLFLAGRALPLASAWQRIPGPLHAFGDRVFWLMLAAAGLRMGQLAQASVAYTSNWRTHYLLLGELPPPDAKDLSRATLQALAWWQALSPAEQAAQCTALGFDPSGWLASLLPSSEPPSP